MATNEEPNGMGSAGGVFLAFALVIGVGFWLIHRLLRGAIYGAGGLLGAVAGDRVTWISPNRSAVAQIAANVICWVMVVY